MYVEVRKCVYVCVCKEEMCGVNILACGERAFVISVVGSSSVC